MNQKQKTNKREIIKRIAIALIALCLIVALLLPILTKANPPDKVTGMFHQQTTNMMMTNTITAQEGDTQMQAQVRDLQGRETAQDYQQYLEYLFNNTDGKENAVFSSESLRIALDMYGELLTEEDRKQIREFLNEKDYLSYIGNDTFKIVNRLWVNQEKQFHLPEDNPVYPMMYEMSMRDEAKATAEKDQFVSKETNGFITSTPTRLNADVLFDAMNILYFKDKWADGDKQLKPGKSTFTNADGSQSEVDMIFETSDAYQQGSNAKAYTMAYKDGFLFTAVLPDEGVNLEEINLNEFLSDNMRYTDADVYFEMPEFEISSTYDIKFEDFGMMPGEIDPNIYTGPTLPPSITQVDKIRVDHEGTEAAAVTEIVREKMALEPNQNHVDIICDRPFLFYITDTINGDIAFVGLVRNMGTDMPKSN